MSNLSELLPAGGAAKEFEPVASGTLPNGRAVVLKANGQVEILGESTAVGFEVPVGNKVVFNEGNTGAEPGSVAFDPNTAGKFVVVYHDNPAGTGAYGTAIVGTVSGNSITFGTEVVFNAANTEKSSIAFDPNTAGKFVVSYHNNGNSSRGTAIVGTVSGTSISFGTAVVYESGVTIRPRIDFFESPANKVVITYRNYSSSWTISISRVAN